MRKQLKRTLGILLSIVLALTLMPQMSLRSEAAGNTVKGVFTSDGTMYIIYDGNSYSAGGTYEGKTISAVYDCDGGNGKMANYTNVNNAPWYNNRSNISAVVIGYGVTHIGNNAFGKTSDAYQNLTSVTFSNTVTSIGELAFCKSAVTSITIPASVTSIGLAAFFECNSLVTLNFADRTGALTIGNSAFYDTRMASITFPNTLTSIGSDAFMCCTNLTSVTVPDSVTSLGSGAFMRCEKLEEAVLGAGILTIPAYTFFLCESLETVTFSDEVTSIGEGAFQECYKLVSITIPNSVTAIGERAFEYCQLLNSIIIPEGITEINANTFHECYSLTSITVPESVESIGEDAFSSSGLQTVEFKSVNTTVADNAFTDVGKYTYSNTNGHWESSDQNVPLAELIISYGFAGGVPDENHNWKGGLFTATITSPITLNATGGTINSGDVTSYVEGNEVTLPTDVTRDGYTFGGWYDNSGCTGTAVTTIPATATGPQEFWAKWDREPTPIPPTPIVITYKVNFDPNGGIYNGDNLEIEEGKPFGFSYSDGMIMRKGYLFAGWYTAPVGGERVKSDTIFDGTTTTLYAHWVKVFTGKVWSFEAVSYTSGRLTVEVQRPATSVSGYEVSFSTDGKTWYKREQNITWENAPVSIIYLSELLSGKYKVRVRAFRYDSAGEKVFGAWSGIKNVNIK